MGYLIAPFAFLARLCRPSQAVHASPLGRVAGVLAEARRNRSRRVRKYAERPRFVAFESPSLPPVPAPRRPIDAAPALPATLGPFAAVAPVVSPRELGPALVRGCYRAHEASRAQHRTDRSRLGFSVSPETATAAQVSA